MPLAPTLFQLSPMPGLDLSGVFGRRDDSKSLERQRLELMRQQFDFERKQTAESNRLKELQAAGLAAKERIAREEAAKAELLKQRQAGALKYSEAIASGQPDQVEALIPYLESLGSGVDITRGAGLPTYRFHMDAEADRNTGWETATRPLDQGAYDETPPELAPAPTPGPTGTVSDLQAQADERLSRLSPALKDIVTAHPYDYRETADEARQGIERLNLPVDKAITEYRQQLSGPIDLIKAQLENEAAKEQKSEPTEVQKSTMRTAGRNAADKTFQRQNIGAAASTVELADRVIAALKDPNPAVQSQAGALLLELGHVKGQPSDKDLGLALGDENLSAFDKAAAWIQRQVAGGFGNTQREGLIKWARAQKDNESRRLYEWLDSADRMAASKSNQFEREGVLEFRNSLPARVLSGYEEWKRTREKASGKTDRGAGKTAELSGGEDTDPEEIDDELMLQAADAGLDWEQIKPLVSTESGGNPRAKNQKGSSAAGLFQFTDETARAAGLKNADEYAALPPSEQIRLGIERFKKLGLDESSTADDYAMANAAPAYIDAPDDTVIEEYRSGTAKGDLVRKQNPGWVPPGGGEITPGSIKAFYRKHRGAAAGGADKAEDERALEILRRP